MGWRPPSNEHQSWKIGYLHGRHRKSIANKNEDVEDNDVANQRQAQIKVLSKTTSSGAKVVDVEIIITIAWSDGSVDEFYDQGERKRNVVLVLMYLF